MDKPIIEKLPLHIDDRGSVYCAVDNMGRNYSPEYLNVVRTYVVHNWKAGMIRAWHGHSKGWTGLHVIHGAAKLVAKPINEEVMCSQRMIVTFSDRNPGIFWVPPGWYNGSMSLVDNTKILVYSTQTFEEVKEDDIRAQVSHNDYLDLFKVEHR